MTIEDTSRFLWAVPTLARGPSREGLGGALVESRRGSRAFTRVQLVWTSGHGAGPRSWGSFICFIVGD